MKRILITTALICTLFSYQAVSQGGAAINNTGAASDPSAMLDISGTSGGVLINRMTTAERNTIVSPAKGLLIYNLDCDNFNYNAGTPVAPNWLPMTPYLNTPSAAGNISGASAVCPGQNNVTYTVSNITGATSYDWIYSGIGATINGNGSTVSIDFSAGAVSGQLSVTGLNVCGNGITSPAFNITVNSLPSAPAPSAHNPSATQIIWNWNTANGATGYRYNTINNFNTSVDIGNNTSYLQTGLVCNNSYTLYVWAYNACGNSSSVTLNANTLVCNNCPMPSVTFNYRGSSVTYGTVSGQSTSCWLDRNLGASAVATNYDHAAGYGDLFQWGRLDDGHQLRNASVTSVLSSTDNPGHAKCITDVTPPYDWRDPKNDLLWQGVSGTNNPCPSGWRLPTVNELNNEKLSWPAGNYLISAYNTSLKLPAGGYKSASNGVLYQEAEVGAYWTSAVNGTEVHAIYYTDNGVWLTGDWSRASSFSVRCILN